MAEFNADIRDLKFVLFEQLDVDRLLKSPPFNDFTREDLEMILEEAYKLAKDVFAPANEPGDRQGCTHHNGKVSVPECFHEPFRQFINGGWLALSSSVEFGGQGAPQLMRCAVDDIFFGANIALNLGILLTPGAAHLIEVFGSDELKRRYCRKMCTGVWTGTMCLTESGAGSDVGASKAKATPSGDHFLIEGEKIFITFGEHDLTENIVHCVLARVDGDPPGTRGLSLFVVPKFLVNADGSLGEANDVACSSIEHKMGINGSPTCTMTFGANGQCRGWLLGERGKGMRAMFQMMNEARIAVGMQGAALGNAAYQSALRYCVDRLQGPHVTKFKDPEAPRVPIIEHPDVRMMLMRQKAYAEGCRALLLFAAYCLDRVKVAADERERGRYQALVDILTPICKAYCSDMGFRVTEWALQCHGGYGYLKDYPAEQYMRDAKIASIYEGTNGIQALDLVGRKISVRGGANVMVLAGMLNDFIKQHAEHPFFEAQVAELARARDAWMSVNAAFAKSAAKRDVIPPLLSASTYLSLCGDLLVAYFLLDQAVKAQAKLFELYKDSAEAMNEDDAEALFTDVEAAAELSRVNPEARFLDGKLKTARYFCAYELPSVHAKAEAIKSGDSSAMDIIWRDADAFASR